MHRLNGEGGQGRVHESRVGILGVFLEGSQTREGTVAHVLLPRVDEALQPELDGAGAGVGGDLAELLQGLVQQDHDGLLRRAPGEGAVDGVAPELHAHLADGGVRDELGEAHELEVEGADRIVGVLPGFGDEVANQVRVII